MRIWPRGRKGHQTKADTLRQPEEGNPAFNMRCGETEQEEGGCWKTGFLIRLPKDL